MKGSYRFEKIRAMITHLKGKKGKILHHTRAPYIRVVLVLEVKKEFGTIGYSEGYESRARTPTCPKCQFV